MRTKLMTDIFYQYHSKAASRAILVELIEPAIPKPDFDVLTNNYPRLNPAFREMFNEGQASLIRHYSCVNPMVHALEKTNPSSTELFMRGHTGEKTSHGEFLSDASFCCFMSAEALAIHLKGYYFGWSCKCLSSITEVIALKKPGIIFFKLCSKKQQRKLIGSIHFDHIDLWEPIGNIAMLWIPPDELIEEIWFFELPRKIH